MWGYADVGADIYAALGLVIAAAQGAASLAFAAAGIIYIMIGFAYTELAATYPVAGGGHYFALRGLGDFWGFVAGAALLLDYTIDIALFTVASAGYINFFLPYFGIQPDHFLLLIGPLRINYLWLLESLFMILFLIWLNVLGIRESSLFNELFGAFDITIESSIIVFGFLFAWRPELLVHQWQASFPTLHNFMYGSSLGIISFVGLESISQAAQETKRPATIIPRTSVTLIFTVFIFATAFSSLSLGVLPWQTFAQHIGDPIATLAHAIPYIGALAGPVTALLGATILLISANSGVMSASRLTYSMSELSLITKWFDRVSPKYRTPVRTIVVFSGIGILEMLLSFLTPQAMDTLGNMYAFGATLGYLIVFISLIKLRFSDPYTPRPYKMPLNIKLPYRDRTVEFPVLGILGFLGVGMVLFEVILTHRIGRVAGPIWVVLGILYYLYFRKANGMPLAKSVERNWEAHQMDVLTSAEEFDLAEEYRLALKERDERIKRNEQAKADR
ncbi:MAG: APC family permease [Deltaproteobacteria bacterium]|nr:APC family permease [Deltaproteobacteria bacterium]